MNVKDLPSTHSPPKPGFILHKVTEKKEDRSKKK
jgi:hypothetical protein